MTLIQLISDQTLRNILPIIALRPERVISIASTGRFFEKEAHIVNAVTSMDIPCEFAPPVNLKTVSPSIQIVHTAVKELISTQSSPLINYTGGTKEMSIGAWTVAKEMGIPSVYCDTPREIRSGGTAPLPALPPFSDIASDLKVSTILAASGFQKDKHWRIDHQNQAIIQFGETSFQLSRENPDAYRTFRQSVRTHGLGNKNRAQRQDVERANKQPIPLEKVHRPWIEAAIKANLLRQENGGVFFSLPNSGNLKQRSNRLARLVMQIDGGAFEAAVRSELQRSNRYSDFLQGVQPSGSTQESPFGETDFLAYSPQDLSLTLISCKTTPPSLEHWESLMARKEKLGGRFARGILAVQSCGPAQEKALRRRGRLLGIKTAVGDEILTSFS